MGSFNMECFASKRIIKPGDICYLMAIYQQKGYSQLELSLNNKQTTFESYAASLCYSNCFWAPVRSVIQVKYSDYGNFSFVRSAHNKLQILALFNLLNARLYAVKQGNNQYHEQGIDFQELYQPSKNYTWEQLEEIWEVFWEVQKSARTIVDVGSSSRALAFACMHKKAYRYFEEYFQTQEYYTGKTLVQKVDEELFEYAQEVFEVLKEKNQEKRSFKEVCEQDAFLDSIFQKLLFSWFGTEAYWSRVHVSDPQLKVNALKTIYNFIRDNPEATTVSIQCVNKLKQNFHLGYCAYVVYTGLSCFGIKFSPSTFASQDYSNEMGQAYAAFVAAVNS